MLTRTRQGRRATKKAYEHLGLKYERPVLTTDDIPALFDEDVSPE
jgi:hypothetical protein